MIPYTVNASMVRNLVGPYRQALEREAALVSPEAFASAVKLVQRNLEGHRNIFSGTLVHPDVLRSELSTQSASASFKIFESARQVVENFIQFISHGFDKSGQAPDQESRRGFMEELLKPESQPEGA